jgi:hypothetical protein
MSILTVVMVGIGGFIVGGITSFIAFLFWISRIGD